MSSRAQIVLWYDEGYRKGEIAAMSGPSRPTVDKWGSSHLVGFCSQVITESGCLVDTGSDCFRRPVRVAA